MFYTKRNIFTLNRKNDQITYIIYHHPLVFHRCKSLRDRHNVFHDVHIYAIMHMFDIGIVVIIFCNNFPKTKVKYRISAKGLSAIKFTKKTSLVKYVGK